MSKDEIIKLYGLNDQQAKVVLDESRELIVPAGAGSGKTKTLVTKVVNLLKNGNDLESFLVLTFTKKAATEMKERIKKELKSANLHSLANKIDSSNISTFDAFAYNFVKQNASLIGLDSNIELLDQAVFLSTKKKIAEELILSIILNEKRDSDKYKFIENFTDKTNEETLVNDLISVYEKISETHQIDRIYPEDIILKRNLFRSDELKMELEEISYEFCDLNFELLNNMFNYLDYLNNKVDIKPVYEVKRISYKEIDPYTKEKIEKVLKPYRDLLKENPDVTDIDDIYNKQIEDAKILIDILKIYERRIKEFKKETNKYEFNDVATFLNQILKQDIKALERLKGKFKYVFVDEYQDTSSVQSEFLEMLIKDNHIINVLYVGDIKQSIYKFRNAKPETFIHKLETIKSIPLSTNYRSSSKIIDFVNDIFIRILNDKKKYDIDYKDNHHMESGSKLYKEDLSSNVFLEELYTEDLKKPKNDPVEEAFVIGYRIKKLLEENRIENYKDVAILARNTTSFKIFKDVFKYLDIPLQVQVDQKLKSTYLLKLISNILKLSMEIFETNKENIKEKRFNYFSVARSELFEYSDYRLFNDLIDYKGKKLEISDEIFTKCKSVYKAIYTKTNYEIIDTVVNEFDLYEKIIYATKKEDKEYQIEYLYNISQTLSDLNVIGENFALYIYQMAYDDNVTIKLSVLQDESENSVRLTNIHQSKGLEYNTLFLCGLNKKFSGNKIRKFKYSEEAKLLIQQKFDDSLKKPVYELIAQMIKTKGLSDEKKSALKEEIRLLYVALTRPKKALYIITTPKDDYSKLESFTDYLYEHEVERLVKKENVIKHKEFLKDSKYYQSLKDNNLYYSDKIEKLEEVSFKKDAYLQEEPKVSLSIQKLIDNKLKNNLLKGTIMHEMFEYAKYFTEETKIKDFYSQSFAGKKLSDALMIHNELEFMYEEKNILNKGIIDMVAIYPDQVHIIDYKTRDINPDKYKSQLDSYKNYLSMVYPRKTIKTFLYSIALENLVEVK